MRFICYAKDFGLYSLKDKKLLKFLIKGMAWLKLCFKKAIVDDIQLEKKESGKDDEKDKTCIPALAVSSCNPSNDE